jgi:hypothetical protein
VRRRDVRQSTGDLRWSPRRRPGAPVRHQGTSTMRQPAERARDTRAGGAGHGQLRDGRRVVYVTIPSRTSMSRSAAADIVIPPGAYPVQHDARQLDTFRRRHACQPGLHDGRILERRPNTLTIRSEYACRPRSDCPSATTSTGSTC